MGKNGLSATEIGSPLGLNPRQTNKMLEMLGLVEKNPYGSGHVLTEAGKQVAHHVDYDNGYGGYARRDWFGTYFDPEKVAELPITDELVQLAKDEYAADLMAKRLANAASRAEADEAFRATQVEINNETIGSTVNWGHVALVLGSAVVVIGGTFAVKKYGPDIARLWEKHATPRIAAVRRRVLGTPPDVADVEQETAPE